MKTRKKLRAALPPSEAVEPLIFQFGSFSIWIFDSNRQPYLLSQEKSFNTDSISSGSSTPACLTTTQKMMIKKESDMKKEIYMKMQIKLRN